MDKVVRFMSLDELLGFLMDKLRGLYKEALSGHGSFHIAFSGGRSIVPVLEGFRGLSMDWQRVHIYQVDERIVPVDSDESNQRLLREGFSQWVNIPEKNLHFVPIKDPEESALQYEETLRRSLPEGLFDALVLGIGKDCHIGSLFPSGPYLEERQRLVVPVRKEGIPQERISLSVRGMRSSRMVFLLVLGKEKEQALQWLLDETIPPVRCPGKYLLSCRGTYVLVFI